MKRQSKPLLLTPAALLALHSASTQMESGSIVLTFPDSTSPNAVRDIQHMLMSSLSKERESLRKAGKLLEINKYRDKTTGQRGVVVAISQRVTNEHKTKAKLVPTDGEWAPDYNGILDIRIRPS